MHAAKNGTAQELSLVSRPQELNRTLHPHASESKTVLDSGFHARGFRIPGTWFRSLSVGLRFRIPIVTRIPVLLSCDPNSKAQEPGFHKIKFPRFRIPQAKFSRIPDSTSKNFPDSGFWRQTFPGFRILKANFSRIPDSTSKIFPDSGFHKQSFPGFRIPQAKFSRIPDSGFPYMGRTSTYKLALKEVVERI